jgi:hypothetical protein
MNAFLSQYLRHTFLHAEHLKKVANESVYRLTHMIHVYLCIYSLQLYERYHKCLIFSRAVLLSKFPDKAAKFQCGEECS